MPTPVLARPATAGLEVPPFDDAPAFTPSVATPALAAPRRTGPVLLLASGLVFMAMAGLIVSQLGATGRKPNPVAPVAPVTPAADSAPVAPSAFTLTGPGDISLVRQVYEPGYASGWHTHPGIHAVEVLSGTLTVYDGNCVAHTFGPGQPYIGGQELHLARNETAAPVEMVVTYVSPSAPQNSTRHFPPPAGCPVAG